MKNPIKNTDCRNSTLLQASTILLPTLLHTRNPFTSIYAASYYKPLLNKQNHITHTEHYYKPVLLKQNPVKIPYYTNRNLLFAHIKQRTPLHAYLHKQKPVTNPYYNKLEPTTNHYYTNITIFHTPITQTETYYKTMT